MSLFTAFKTKMRYISHWSEWPTPKVYKNECWRGCEEKGTLLPTHCPRNSGNVIWYSYSGEQHGGSLKIEKQRFHMIWKILRDDGVKVLHSICQQIWKTQQWPQDWKRSAFIPFPKRGNAKECPNCHTTALISHTNKIMPQILQANLQQYMNWELPDVQTEFRKGKGTRDQIAKICWIIQNTRELQKNI